MSQYVLISLNKPERDLILLDVPEYARQCLNELFWLCQGPNMLQYSYNNIIITVTNIIELEFLCARILVNSWILSQHKLEHKNNENQKTLNKLFFLTTVTSEIPKYLVEKLGVFLNVKQQKWSKLKTFKKTFLSKNVFN